MTLNQKFILLLSTDKFFNEECRYARAKWNIPKNKVIATVKESDLRNLPIQYRKDLWFILLESKLPQRYFWPLHQYLLLNKTPEIKKLPPPVRVFTSHRPTADMGNLVIEVDLDAGKKEIANALKDIYESRTMLQKIGGTNKIFQPIRNFESFLKLAKRRSLDSQIDFDDFWKIGPSGKADLAAMKKIARKMKTKWRVQIFRNAKSLSKVKRISVKKREKYEDYLKNVEIGW